MRRSLVVILLTFACATAIVAPAGAVTWGGEVFGAFNTFSMKDMNAYIAAQPGVSADEITQGFGGGLGLRVWPNTNWMIAGTWEPLFASTKDNVTNDELKLTTNSFQATVGYFFPSASKGRFGIGAGPGIYMLNGKLTVSGSPDVEYKGTAVGFHVVGMGEWEVSPGFGITGSAGYRMATVTDTEIGGVSQSPKLETDYSGVVLRAGMTFSMPSSK